MATPGIMIAGTGSGCGKTTVTCALLKHFKNRGWKVKAFKCGPDYIDPMYHRRVIGVPSYNLDRFFLKEQALQSLYAATARDAELCVVEGVMGIYDGIDVSSEEGSAYEMAKLLGLPIILAVDAGYMGRSLLAHIAGFLKYDTEKLIQGIFLNRISEGFYRRMQPLIEKEFGIPVLGFLPSDDRLVLKSRHLGLHLPEEVESLQDKLHAAAELLESCCNVDEIIKVAQKASPLFEAEAPSGKSMAEKESDVTEPLLTAESPAKSLESARIAVAMDEAFCFYYEENFDVLRKAGAELVFFSPIHDKELPAGTQGLLMGGGYPENYAEELERNRSMRACIREAIANGMPVLAECGGFMYLHNSITISDGTRFDMCHVIDADCYDAGHLVRFGYVELYEKSPAFFTEGECIKGHEFHCYDSTNNGRACIAKQPTGDWEWDCVMENGDCFWGFPHLYYPSNPTFVAKFVKAAAMRKD